jgi:hypothetical protein
LRIARPTASSFPYEAGRVERPVAGRESVADDPLGLLFGYLVDPKPRSGISTPLLSVIWGISLVVR